jgi:4-hydroxy-tetrahydrodipicolinate synthase
LTTTPAGRVARDPRAISAALELMGMRVGPLRAPLRPLEKEHVDELRRILVDLAVLPSA